MIHNQQASTNIHLTWSGVENVDVVFVLMVVDVADELVQVHEPGVGGLVLGVNTPPKNRILFGSLFSVEEY